jgi:hypothetical protein
MDDAEEPRSVIEPVPAEHSSAGHAPEILQLIQYEIFEIVGLRSHQTIQRGLRAATIRTAMGNVIWSPRWYCVTALKMRRFTSCL